MRLRIIWAQSMSTAIRACIRSSLTLLLCSRLWPDSLSLWERAGVRVRSIAGETKGKEFLSSRAVSPHPNPLPEGEGTFISSTHQPSADPKPHSPGRRLPDKRLRGCYTPAHTVD